MRCRKKQEWRNRRQSRKERMKLGSMSRGSVRRFILVYTHNREDAETVNNVKIQA